jgi:hypothetical protein
MNFNIIEFIKTRNAIHSKFYKLLEETMAPLTNIPEDGKWYINNKLRIVEIYIDYERPKIIVFKLSYDGYDIICKTNNDLTEILYLDPQHTFKDPYIDKLK